MGMPGAFSSVNVTVTGYLTAVNILVVNYGSIEGHQYVPACTLEAENQII